MSNDQRRPPPAIGWREAAEQAAANLGFGSALAQLPAEQWQKVLANVETRMRMKGMELPADWRDQLARLIGRSAS